MENIRKNKRILLIISLIVILFLVAMFATCNKRTKTTIGQPKTLVVNDIVLAPILANTSDKILYFDKNSKLFKQLLLNSNISTKFDNQTFENVQNVYWSPDQSKAIITTTEQTSDTVYKTNNIYFDFDNPKTISNLNLQNFAWSPDNLKIAYTTIVEDKPDYLSVNISNPDGTNGKEIGQIGIFGAPISLYWLSQDEIVIVKPSYIPAESYDLTSEQTQGIIYRINPASSKISQDTNFSNISDAKFSPNSKYMIYNKVDNDKTFVYSDGKEQTLDIAFDSLSSTCWSKNSNNFYGFLSSTDLTSQKPMSLYKISMSDLIINKIFDFSIEKNSTGKNYFLDNLIINSSQDKIYFTRQEQLYELRNN